MDVLARGIDVSGAQSKSVDWGTVKASGVQFAMIKAGYGRYAKQIDSAYRINVEGCDKAGLPYGIYWYSYAQSGVEARIEAQTCLSIIQGCKPLYPVVIDIEDNSQSGLSKTVMTDIVQGFCEEIQAAGYLPGWYTFAAWAQSRFEVGRLPYDFWLAQWASAPTYHGSYGMWQYSNAGTVPGIPGAVDLDYAYVDYPTQVKARGLNGWQIETAPQPEVPSVSGGFADEFLTYRKTLQDNDSAAWSKEARDWAVSSGLIAGGDILPDGSPNYMWGDFLTREQAAQLFYKFWQLLGR